LDVEVELDVFVEDVGVEQFVVEEFGGVGIDEYLFVV